MEVSTVLFSEGTYQVQVLNHENGEEFWPFLQINDLGELKDAFCTCEEEGRCSHQKESLAFITAKGDPLHVRFRNSFWNQICLMAAKRHGFEAKSFKIVGESYFIDDVKVITALNNDGKRILSEFIENRVEETEETSLKFSNLSEDDIALWRKGKPTEHLSYELSPWSDLAKAMMIFEEHGSEYKLDFSGGDLPDQLTITFPYFEIFLQIAKVNWPSLIPTLPTVETPFCVHEFRNVIVEKMEYDAEKRELRVFKSVKCEDKEEKPIVSLNGWDFYPDHGFYPTKTDEFFEKEVMREDEIADVLRSHTEVIKRYLKNVSFHEGAEEPKYHIYFDDEKNLHIDAYIHEIGDMQRPLSTRYGPWIYVEGGGFCLLENVMFDDLKKVVHFPLVAEFVTKHKTFLNNFEGFQIHLTALEMRMTYRIEKKKALIFENQSELLVESQDILDFGEWAYVASRGFYSKAAKPGKIQHGTRVPWEEITDFIVEHHDELEQVGTFFHSDNDCPLEKFGLEVTLGKKSVITITPHIVYKKGVDAEFIGDYVYEEGKGFCAIPAKWHLPKKFRSKVEIQAKGEAYFVTHELSKIKPFITKIDPKLVTPRNFYLHIKQIERDGPDWVMSVNYESELGQETVGRFLRAVQKNDSYIMCKAGLITLKDPRFGWLRNLSKERIISNGRKVKLTTLEWIKMTLIEDIVYPRYRESLKLLDQLESFETDIPIKLNRLESQLRPYQEIGVKWLWFLYQNGLSGMLCDEMGLGKTHQAMALLSLVERGEKCLVVCPTSVIYHWEELLEKFLPDALVTTYYGLKRDIGSGWEILLTSFGTLRTDREILTEIDWEVAIFDELQNAKNTQSQTHKVLSEIKARMRIGLTGTPIENRLTELKALFDIVLPQYFPPPTPYREHFVNPIEKHDDKHTKELLSRMIRPFMMRRKKADVLDDLPDKIEEVVHCTMSDEQMTLYKEAFLAERDELSKKIDDENEPVPYVHVFAIINKLKQICNHPALITKEPYQKQESGKWELFLELLGEIRDSGQKLVIFSQYLGMLDIIENHLKEHNIPFAAVRGTTRNRKEELERFRDDPKCEVFVASLKAVGVGVDLVSASVVIHYDRWWNPAVEDQATDRVHRIGQKRGVQVFKLVSKHSIEEHIDNIILKKQGLMEGILGFDDHNHIKQLTRNELKELLELIERDIEF
ncbi:MAG: hypothetical protein SP1CHLAM54_17330 [Chlamydiia bacterium]|nr:hypothetical protein [Chlamydiia bacterium]MCH9616621.1 hypothetical protein [Chlamydiia bacterium]MCH9629351.1 hypothetical protein [Chlamydiia bacterium]